MTASPLSAQAMPDGPEGSPPNDDCFNATVISNGSHPFSNVGATTDGPAHPGLCQYDGQTYQDIWYRYTATCTGTLTASTCGQANYDSDLAVYAGCDCASLLLLGCNDDTPSCPGFVTSRVLVPVIANNCYLIRVGAWGAMTPPGTGTLTVSCAPTPPCVPGAIPNDCCATALAIGNGQFSFSTIGANTDGLPNTGSCALDGQTYHDIWFNYVATCSGTLVAGTCGQASFDTDLALYSGCTCSGLTLLSCSEDAPGCAGGTSRAEAFVSQGQCYKIRVGGRQNGDSGTGVLTVACFPVCEPDCAGALDEAIIPASPEPCGANGNGGCNGTPVQFVDGQCGQTWCGTTWATEGERDTDWYSVFLPDIDGSGFSEMTATLSSYQPNTVLILDGECGSGTVAVAFDDSQFCQAGTAWACLASNRNYRVFVGPGTVAGSVFDGYPCSTHSGYRLEIGCAACPCAPVQFCRIGDVNDDGESNGRDVQTFVATLLGDPPQCGTQAFCRLDANGDGAINAQDVAEFAAILVADVNWECVCPAGSGEEMELCGQNTNGGCNVFPPAFVPLECGATMCGTLWAENGGRDTDWYSLFVPSMGSPQRAVEIRVQAQLPCAVFLFSGGCANQVIEATLFVDPCDENAIFECVTADSSYLVLIAPGNSSGGIYDGFPCGLDNGYSLSVDCVPCPP